MGSTFDCTLNFADNIKKNKDIQCLDYNTQDRDDYLYTPNLEDTIDEVEIQQEITIKINYIKIAFKKFSTKIIIILHKIHLLAHEYIYNEDILSKVGADPIGEIKVKDNKKLFKLYKKNKEKQKQI